MRSSAFEEIETNGNFPRGLLWRAYLEDNKTHTSQHCYGRHSQPLQETEHLEDDFFDVSSSV